VAYLQQIDGDVKNITDNSNPVTDNQLTVDGNLADWSGNNFFSADPDDTSGADNPIDWKAAMLAHSSQQLYIGYQSYNPIDAAVNSGTNVPWGWQILIDTDQNAGTGYKQGSIGADYIIEGKHLQRYTGDGSNWSWSSLGNIALAYQGSEVELGLDRALIGDPSTVRIVFRGANQAYNGSEIDIYPNDVNAYIEYQLPGGTDQVNTAPVAANQNVLLSANSTASVTLSAMDAEGSALTYQINGSPQHGTISGDAPNLIYQPQPGFTGSDRFSFIANDGVNNSNTAVVSLTITNDQGGAVFNELSNPLALDGNNSDWVNVTRFNSDPDDISGTNETINWRSAALAHDTQFLHVLYESYNEINAANDSVNYLPWGWQVYLDTDKNSSTGLRIGNIGADYILEGQAIHRYIGLGNNWNWENIGVADSKYDGNVAELRFPRSLIGNPNSLRLILRGNNVAVGGTQIDSYPDGQNDRDSSEQFFKYEFSNGSYADGKPIADSQSLSTNRNSSLSMILSGNDASANDLTYRIDSNPEHGTITGTAPDLIYTPTSGYIGSDSFTFVTNNGALDSIPATVSISVTATSNAAVTNNVPSLNIDGSVEDWNNLTAFSDDPDDMLLASDTINWQNATMAHSADTLYLLYRNRGLINPNTPSGSYIPWGWQTYLDTDNDATTGFKIGNIGADFMIEATSVNSYSGSSNSWDWQTVAIAEIAYNNDIAELALPLAALGNPANILLVFKGNNLAVGGSDSDLYPDNADIGSVDDNFFSYNLNNVLARVSVRPQASNQAVSAVANKATTITLNASDPDGESLSYIVVKAPAHGTLSVIGEEVTYTPEANYVGEDSFDYVVNDGVFDSSVAKVSISLRSDESTSAGGSNGNDPNSSGDSTEESGGGSIEWHFGIALFVLAVVAYRRRTLAALR